MHAVDWEVVFPQDMSGQDVNPHRASDPVDKDQHRPIADAEHLIGLHNALGWRDELTINPRKLIGLADRVFDQSLRESFDAPECFACGCSDGFDASRFWISVGRSPDEHGLELVVHNGERGLNIRTPPRPDDFGLSIGELHHPRLRELGREEDHRVKLGADR